MPPSSVTSPISALNTARPTNSSTQSRTSFRQPRPSRYVPRHSLLCVRGFALQSCCRAHVRLQNNLVRTSPYSRLPSTTRRVMTLSRPLLLPPPSLRTPPPPTPPISFQPTPRMRSRRSAETVARPATRLATTARRRMARGTPQSASAARAWVHSSWEPSLVNLASMLRRCDATFHKRVEFESP